jgi:hypothetical protein
MRDQRIDPNDRCQAVGKQVLLDGQHLCDALNEPAAVVIAVAVNNLGCDILEDWERDAVEAFLA